MVKTTVHAVFMSTSQDVCGRFWVFSNFGDWKVLTGDTSKIEMHELYDKHHQVSLTLKFY